MKKTMKILTPALAISVLFAFTDVAKVSSWNVDKAHSAINFEVTHFFTPVNGAFEEYSGTILFSPDDLANSKIDFEIDVASINTKNEKRDNHLQSPDFFNAEKYPNIHFEASKFTKKGNNKYVAHGQLTIKDVTKDFDLGFEVLGTKNHPMMEGKRLMGVKATTSLDRTDYDVGVGDWAATAVVGDEVDITLNLELLTDK